jgi:pimeloyl-ACP methyl ester carboxylesterase
MRAGRSPSGVMPPSDAHDIRVPKAERHHVETREGSVSYIEAGAGPVALFVHGVGTNAYLWRHLVAALADERRCIAIDMPLHGRSPARPDQAFGLAAFARLLGGFCDELALTSVDLVANDTGGAIAQIFAARNPHRLRTLTLTNCETHDNVPPKAFKPTVLLARTGVLALIGPLLVRNVPRARRVVFATGYENVDALPEEVVRSFVRPVLRTREHARLFERWLTSLRASDLLEVEPLLRRLEVPSLIAWGTGDRFFETRWAHWLAETLPGATGVVEFPGARLFFPDERARSSCRDFVSTGVEPMSPRPRRGLKSQMTSKEGSDDR